MKIAIIALSLLMAGCAGMCDPNDKKCISKAQDADAVMEGAAVIAIEVSTPPETTTTETRTCSKDWRGNETCTTTTNRN